MVKIVIVRKTGDLEEVELEGKLSNIHKQLGYKTKRNFYDRGSWPWKDNYITLYAKDTGKANQENKYDLPPPLDTELFFNNMVLVKHSDMTSCDEELLDLTVEEWSTCYEKLFGGFENLGAEDSYSSEEEIPLELQTKHGYSKEGGFVVDSDEEEEEWIPNEDEDEEEEEWVEDEDEEEDAEKNEHEDDDEDEDYEEESEDDEEEDNQGSELSEDEYYDD